MGWFRLVNALSTIEGRKKLFLERSPLCRGIAVVAAGRASSAPATMKRKAPATAAEQWRLERWAQIDPWHWLEKFNFAPFHL